MRMLKEKKGWIRIIEAVAAILVIISAVIIFVSNAPNKLDVSENMQSLVNAILTDISLNNTMRTLIITTIDTSGAALDPLRAFVKDRMPIGMKNNSAVCVAINAESNCKPMNYNQLADKQLFVDDRLIFMSDKTRRVMLFIWL